MDVLGTEALAVFQVVPDEVLRERPVGAVAAHAVCHMCRWVSIMPGSTMPPEASTSTVPSGTGSCGPTASIRSPTTRTSAGVRTVWRASIVSTVPPRKTSGRPASGVPPLAVVAASMSSSIGAPVAPWNLPDECPYGGHRSPGDTMDRHRNHRQEPAPVAPRLLSRRTSDPTGWSPQWCVVTTTPTSSRRSPAGSTSSRRSARGIPGCLSPRSRPRPAWRGPPPAASCGRWSPWATSGRTRAPSPSRPG